MKGSEILASLPQAPGPEREKLLLAAVREHSLHDWTCLPVTVGSRKLLVTVSRLPLALGTPDDFFFPTLTCRSLAVAAELQDARLLTARLSDLICQRATLRLRPATQTPDALMAYTTRMRLHSAAVQAQLVGGWAGCGLVSGAGKDWILTNQIRKGRAANYGWHSDRAPYPAVTPGLRVLQPVATAHNLDHVDYSQTCRFVSRLAAVDGLPCDLDEILKRPDLAQAVSHEGALRYLDPREVAADTDPAPTQPQLSFPPGTPSVAGDFVDVPFIRARNFTPAQRGSSRLIVVHTMESAEKPGTARAVAQWFAGANAPKASAHFCVGPDEVVQCVRLRDVAWGAPGANATGVHFELVGRAKQSASDWLDAESDATLRNAARRIAVLCRRDSIPIEHLSIPELKAGKPGLVGHHDVSLAFRRSDHWDPGPSFPWAYFLDLIRSAP